MLLNPQLLIASAQNTNTVNGLTHNFYRYPARFSPLLAKEAIKAFSKPGDLVLDPFVGGGTTLVEASYLGRRSIGYDISTLATFISQVKTTVLSQDEINQIREWAHTVKNITIKSKLTGPTFWIEKDYQKNLNNSQTWRIRNLIEGVLAKIAELSNPKVTNFLRCAVLKTGQWALDGKSIIPSVSDFRLHLFNDIKEMLRGLIEYSNGIAAHNNWDNGANTIVINGSAVGIEEDELLQNISPKLILMSPPYPGVHVLYHRWQIRGRKETPAPFWIANQLDGNGPSYYTFGDRKTHQKQSYFNGIQEVFYSLSKISDSETTLVQMVAFSEPDLQLPRYLRLLDKAGFEEVFLTHKETHKRIWRKVPNRKWYASLQGNTASSREVVLIHKKRKGAG